MRLRPPAIPLITVDPNFSVWSDADKLNEKDTVHWTTKPMCICGYINVDGVPMFAFYEGGYDIMPLFQHSIMTRIEMPEETKKYL